MDKKLTFAEIKEILMRLFEEHEDYGDGLIAFAEEGLDYVQVPEDFEPLPEDTTWEEVEVRMKKYVSQFGLGACEFKASHGGMDQGSDWWKIWYFPKHDVYVKAKGWYQSHHGVEFYDGWDGVFEVHPAEETIIVYKAV